MRVIGLVYWFVLICAEDSGGVEVVVRVIGGGEWAKVVALRNGYDYKGPVKGFENIYILHQNSTKISSPGKRSSSSHISEDVDVLWYEEQNIKQRQKRDFVDISDTPHERVKRIQDDGISTTNEFQGNPEDIRLFNDELWNHEWYLKNTRSLEELPDLDLNVLKVYSAGITGRNVRISVIDDGLEYTHEDLRANYEPEISYDCNEEDNDPMPRYDMARTNSHGTRCAGEIAMVANNEKCGVGVAFNAKIGGIKVLDGFITDRLEGTALSFGLGVIDIYSASWGPTDDGRTVDGPGELAKEALERGTKLGRGGKGSIFVWASGNGGGRGDNCNCDGYVNSIYTVSIGSVNERGIFPWYGEACASTLAVTYSSGARSDQMIVTTDLYNNCTMKHTGTSASAPLAAGIIALALEANPRLTWRDIQYLIVFSSAKSPLLRNPGWQKNGIGLWFNTRFGFGLIDAYKMVQMASYWVAVPEKRICKVEAIRKSMQLRAGQPLSVPIFTSGCKWTGNEVNHLEHVEIRTNIKYSRRGSLEIYLTSPSETYVQLLSRRMLDGSPDGFQNWSFMSVVTWGERSQGVWTLTIKDEVGPTNNRGTLGYTELILHGTKNRPAYEKIVSNNKAML
ncbi:neuroendocrine convertase 1-like [Harmonia axyridis]|uniref:neuroendocrine convertase 1-like n=1 Tax=Harmonia axyridis TaxID=115357 RepID=UPI001E275E00|nr:neuroendocrine convertase 1-like [Harmonia axyridis]